MSLNLFYSFWCDNENEFNFEKNRQYTQSNDVRINSGREISLKGMNFAKKKNKHTIFLFHQ